MKCEEAREMFGVYWDLQETDERRQSIDQHIENCPECSEEFDLWLESTMLIQSAAADLEESIPQGAISSKVMDRIYADETWRLPVADRMYHFTYKFRRNVAAVIAASVALFIFTFVFSLTSDPGVTTLEEQSTVFGRIGDPIIITAGSESGPGASYSIPANAVASLKGFNEPFTVKAGPIRTVRDYLLFVSLLGLTSTLLIMNWLSRTKA